MNVAQIKQHDNLRTLLLVMPHGQKPGRSEAKALASIHKSIYGERVEVLLDYDIDNCKDRLIARPVGCNRIKSVKYLIAPRLKPHTWRPAASSISGWTTLTCAECGKQALA